MADRAMNAPRSALLPLLALAACSPHARLAEKPPLQGARIGGPFALVDGDGRRVTDASFAGRWRVMYFGYTYCPDVCPSDMAHLGAALKLLDRDDPKLARSIAPVFVSVDPARDTPAVLKQFTAAFDPRLIGLTGSEDAIDRVAKEYGVFHQKGDPAPGGGYMVNHSVVAYLMDPAGRPIALLPIEGTPAAIEAEIRHWAS